MDPEFWLDRWKEQRIGFHLDEANPTLAAYWQHISVVEGTRVLVPLCGKSNDLEWLARQGLRVVGVELSPLAVHAFWSERGLEPDRSQRGAFHVTQCGELSLWQGSFFDLSTHDVDSIGGFYDRASIIALPPRLRDAYARTLSALIPPDVSGLMITIEYPVAEMDGPPFSVNPQDVTTLLGADFVVETLHSEDIFSPESRLAERGVTALKQHVLKLTRKGEL